MNRIYLIILAHIFLSLQAATAQSDSTKKSGWELGGILPMLAYDSDLGFQYGALAEIYDYGSGEFLPDYKQKFYIEISRSTKGNATYQLTFDSKNIFGNGNRLIGELNYVTEKALDFYGFNGAISSYNPDLENNESNSYLSRVYFRHERKMLRMTADLHLGIIKTDILKLFAGIGYFNISIGSVNIKDWNDGLDDNEKLPSTDSVPGLYETYVTKGIIPEKDKNGGNQFLLRFGLLFDTRDNEAFPTKGVWAEAFAQAAPQFKDDFGYGQFIATLRQYFSLSNSGNPVFAYRLSYSTKIWGEIPFYMLPFYFNTTETRDGFGSGKTLRGILRNRIAADAVLFENFELRWKFIKFGLFDNEFYIGLGLFFDTGLVTYDYIPPELSVDTDIGNSGGRFHNSLGAGLHAAMNENFVLSFDWGKALNRNDGDSGFYIQLNWLF
jgi:outer membrane protein assembly factor BamA